MAKLSTSMRNALPKTAFGLQGSRRFPVENKSHAADAKARASQMEKAGKLSPASKAQIDKKANAKLGKPSAKPLTSFQKAKARK